MLASIKSLNIKMFSQFSSQKLTIFLQNFFRNWEFFLKNHWDFWPKIFEDSTIRNGLKTKTKMDIWAKIFEEQRSSKLHCNTHLGFRQELRTDLMLKPTSHHKHPHHQQHNHSGNQMIVHKGYRRCDSA